MKRLIRTMIALAMLLSLFCFAGCTETKFTNLENREETEVKTEPLSKLYYVTPWNITVEAFTISDSDSHSEDTDVGGKTINVDGPCTLSVEEDVEIAIYVLEKGTTLDRFCDEVWDEDRLEYTKIPDFRLSSRDCDPDLPVSVFLDEGTYVAEVTIGGDGVYVHLVVGDGQSAD